jgi:hypothetical protein
MLLRGSGVPASMSGRVTGPPSISSKTRSQISGLTACIRFMTLSWPRYETCAQVSPGELEVSVGRKERRVHSHIFFDANPTRRSPNNSS